MRGCATSAPALFQNESLKALGNICISLSLAVLDAPVPPFALPAPLLNPAQLPLIAFLLCLLRVGPPVPETSSVF